MQTVPVKAVRLPKPWALDNRIEATQYKGPVNQEGEKRDSVPLIGQDSRSRASGGCERDSIPITRQDSKTSGRQKAHDKQPDCTGIIDKPGDTSRNISSPRLKVIRTRSEQAVCRPL